MNIQTFYDLNPKWIFSSDDSKKDTGCVVIHNLQFKCTFPSSALAGLSWPKHSSSTYQNERTWKPMRIPSLGNKISMIVTISCHHQPGAVRDNSRVQARYQPGAETLLYLSAYLLLLIIYLCNYLLLYLSWKLRGARRPSPWSWGGWWGAGRGASRCPAGTTHPGNWR